MKIKILAIASFLVLTAMITAGCSQNINTTPVESQQMAADRQQPLGEMAGLTYVTTIQTYALGEILTDDNKMALYIFKEDTKTGASECYGTCAENWLPLTVSDSIMSRNTLQGTLATITRTDGTKQATYNGKPLYYYVKDKSPGDTFGEGINDVWHTVVITPPANKEQGGDTAVIIPVAQQEEEKQPVQQTPEGAPQTYQVQITDFAFKPAQINIKAGDLVIWTNEDPVSHTVESDSGSEISSLSLSKGRSYSHTFETTGTYSYHCSIHPSMKGTVIVE